MPSPKIITDQGDSKDRTVGAGGKAEGSDYKGRQYRIIKKIERTFSNTEGIRRGFLGVLAVVCILFFGLFSKFLQNLFTKPKENVRFGVVFPQKPKHIEPSLPIDISSYEALRKAMEKNGSTLYVTDQTGKHQETLLGILGRGGSKKAIQIAKGRALILPNMDVDPTTNIARRWERMVLEEVKMSKILNRLALLSPLSEQVSVTLTESSEHVIPAYISETFENLGITKDWFIIDTKEINSSTWKQGKHFLFKSDEERLDDKNWDSVVDSVLTDVAKICLYDIPVGKDSLNIAVVKKPSDSAVCQYEVRYFGFDFSSKYGFLTIPDAENRPSTSPNIEKATWLLNGILDNIFLWEFGQRYDYGNESASLISLKDRLVQRYIKVVCNRQNLI